FYSLSLHDALPIWERAVARPTSDRLFPPGAARRPAHRPARRGDELGGQRDGGSDSKGAHAAARRSNELRGGAPLEHHSEGRLGARPRGRADRRAGDARGAAPSLGPLRLPVSKILGPGGSRIRDTLDVWVRGIWQDACRKFSRIRSGVAKVLW